MNLKELHVNLMIDKLVALCKTELELDRIPSIEVISNSDTIPGTLSFGVFDGNKIRVIIKNRHPIDVMRTIAHELVHWQQQTTGQVLDGADGSDIENQANALAGVIMRKYGRAYPEFFKTEILCTKTRF